MGQRIQREAIYATRDQASKRLEALQAHSPFLFRLTQARPGLWRALVESPSLEREKSCADYLASIGPAARHARLDELPRRLARFKYRELLRIALRDLGGKASPQELGREQAHLAEAIIEAALRALWPPLAGSAGMAPTWPPPFCVFGMGKLGGEDLNFSSDIDLIYVFQEVGDAGAAPFIKLSQALTRTLSATTPEGFCYRVDMNLRPQGKSGALALSLPATLQYYETFGRTWERAALTKARPVAGDAALGEALLAGLVPFVWRRSLDLRAVDELRDLKAQIDLRAKASDDDVKLSRGGIREVEFFANALALLHGGKEPGLRQRNTLKSLRRLESAGFVSSAHADALEEAYLFLRRCENHLQMVEERQTHRLPETDHEQDLLARGLGFPDRMDFLAALTRHRHQVGELFSKVLGETARDQTPDAPHLALALDSEAPAAQREAGLSRAGFAAPAQAVAWLERLARIPRTPFSEGLGASLSAVTLLAEAARTPDPDSALKFFAEFLVRLPAPQSYLDLLLRIAPARRRLLNLFGQSDYLSRSFLRHPQLLDFLVQFDAGGAHKSGDRLREELSMRASRHADPEARLQALARFKNEETLRIGLCDISGELEVPEVCAQLSALAQGTVDDLLFQSEAYVRERHGKPPGDHRLCVVGLGKLGGEELGYHSDLDLLFVYGGNSESETDGGLRGKVTSHEYFAKVAQRLLMLLQLPLPEGALYRTDTRLRPSGNQGTLVVSQKAFLAHHEKHAQLWERQALTKARAVAGDEMLWGQLRDGLLAPVVYQAPLPPNAAAEIRRLRGRMEKELAQENADQLNPKTGMGGLVDVEFTAQFLQLRDGGANPALRLPGTLPALTALAGAGSLPPADAQLLQRGYLFLRRVELRLRLTHDSSLAHLPTRGRPLAGLARRLGYTGDDAGTRFLSDYRAYTAQVRDVYARALRD